LGEDPFLRRLQTGVQPDQRIAALDALTLLGGWAAAAVLTSAASDPWTAVRAHALELLAEVRDPDAAKALKRAYEGVRKGTTPGSSRDAEIAALGHALKQTSRDGNGRAAAPPNGEKNLTRSAAGSTG
ncbi:MAG: HEAT repeat domain-containing protein, partial [Actinomycetota bacterium]